MKIPCKDCIVLPICKAKFSSLVVNLGFFIKYLNCQLLNKYVLECINEYDIYDEITEVYSERIFGDD